MGIVNVSLHLQGPERVQQWDYGQEAKAVQIKDGYTTLATIYGTAEQLATLGRSITALAISMGAQHQPLPEMTKAAAS